MIENVYNRERFEEIIYARLLHQHKNCINTAPYSKEVYCSKYDSGQYRSKEVEDAWWGWKEAHMVLNLELAKKDNILNRLIDFNEDAQTDEVSLDDIPLSRIISDACKIMDR